MRNFLTATIMALFFAVTATMALSSVANAQGANAQGDGGDEAKRLELARTMHQIRPVDPQIIETIKAVSMSLPEDRREIFVLKMTNVFDKDTLDDISTRAMAETFTVAELEAMIRYFGAPEAKSASEKMPIYWALVQPEISRLIDKAMMDVRLGPVDE